ncbi:MAG: hypothetical protein PWP07_1016 [Epulopiscium sp.]|jgi:NADH:ubiquinone oxidoreductase subunit E|uniref:(2Fe-2S) ferredoxin domain-containing protein n=1 Tax=Defluviitalea raffinosedens TaxID=1450156 RepID=A0A7C8LPH7_9FIRM|nr:(2Fe-2S) ferredoxin domain-containing protein [Defluviitalea raffinosedens]MBZ4669135.1 (2Fe-2S) ferredoxin protein [Defluviitaleaceae bacterium]MDK2787791.1 hypothetical protein [Candidatus Epulonipiscium sp.]KAE9633466.1 (2Fe-2S) ferredoxin domain-containing protein [Defluviitalea raffinosedens]MBM7685936.1 NADH:ubiquinone oxidoreductase subunit E [Defluviitalea raffinosedens]HHW68152.1 (2Fe-2S) ferredoxin domain-containing protein [Candidatus Epulonipiscium sp.]
MVIVEVCIGTDCHSKGAYELVRALKSLVKKNNLNDQVVIKGTFCVGHCTKAVSVKVDHDRIYSVEPEKAEEFFNECIKGNLELCRI